MNFESLDVVEVYRKLREEIERGGRLFHIRLFYYFWRRLSAAVVDEGQSSTESDKKYIELIRGSLENLDRSAMVGMADFAFAEAVKLENQHNILLRVGYWSAMCYLCRYLCSPDWKLVDMASDSFLSALDEFSDSRGPDALKNEFVNLASMYAAAHRFGDADLVDSAQLMIEWASSLPLGSTLPPLVTKV